MKKICDNCGCRIVTFATHAEVRRAWRGNVAFCLCPGIVQEWVRLLVDKLELGEE